MKNKGLAHMGIGHYKGENKTIEAVRQAVSSPLLETTIEGATGVLLNVKGGLDLPLNEVYEAADLVKQVVDPNCNIIFGSGIDESMNDEVEITIIATGFNGSLFDEKEKDLNKVKSDVEAFNNFDGKRAFGANVFGNQQTQTATAPQQPAPQAKPEQVENSSRIHIDDTDIPPFLRKLKKDRF